MEYNSLVWTISRCKGRKTGYLLYYMGIRRNCVLRLMKCLTISHFFVCLPTLELITFGQQLTSKKNRLTKCTIIGDKQLQKRNVATLNSAHQAKMALKCTFDSGWLEGQILQTYDKCSSLWKSWKKVYSKLITKLIPQLHSDHGICRQNGPEHG